VPTAVGSKITGGASKHGPYATSFLYPVLRREARDAHLGSADERTKVQYIHTYKYVRGPILDRRIIFNNIFIKM
jgi:hypothetical protein